MIRHSKPYFEKILVNDISEIINSSEISTGNKLELLHQKLSRYIGSCELFVTSSGTSALFLILRALEIKEGDEIILPTYVCNSVVNSILVAGGIPVFCDVSENWVIGSENVEKVITKRSKAIIIVHIFGIYCDVISFKQFGIPIIEDSCQSFIDEIKGNKLGINSDFSFYSFHATKCLTMGSGGAVAVFNKKFVDKLGKAYDDYKSFFPINEIQAAMGVYQLKNYNRFLVKREEIAKEYFLKLPAPLTKKLKNLQTMFFRFPLVWKNDFETLKNLFDKNGIAIRKGVDELLHLKYNFPNKKTKFNTAEYLFESTVSIPIYPALKRNEIKLIIQTVNSIYENRNIK